MKYVIVQFEDAVDLSLLTTGTPVTVTTGAVGVGGQVFLTTNAGPNPTPTVSPDHTHTIAPGSTGPAT